MSDYETFISRDGYVRISSRKEGKHNKLLHRVIFEDFYKVTLLPNSHIHHKDGNKLNNDISNLELLSPSDHISLHFKNRKFSPEHREKMSKSKCGKNNPMYGKKRPEFAKQMIGENNPFYGKTHSEETKVRLSRINSGKNNPMYGKKLSPESRKKISESKKGEKAWNWGSSKIERHGGIPFLRLNKALGKTVLDITRYLNYANDGAVYGYLKRRNLKWSDL